MAARIDLSTLREIAARFGLEVESHRPGRTKVFTFYRNSNVTRICESAREAQAYLEGVVEGISMARAFDAKKGKQTE